MAVGAATIVLELIVLGLGVSLLLPVFSRLIGQSYPLTDALVHALLMTMGGLVFFGFAFLVSTIFNNWWQAVFIGEGLHVALCAPYMGTAPFPRWNLVYQLVSGESYFRHGEIPWSGLLVSVALAAVMFYISVCIFERQDF